MATIQADRTCYLNLATLGWVILQLQRFAILFTARNYAKHSLHGTNLLQNILFTPQICCKKLS
jgi:hypothetical protein